MLYGCDVSSWNKIAVEASGAKDFGIIKCTEGTDYVNPSYPTQIKYLRDNNKLVAHYHFAQSNAATLEANHFLKQINLQPGDLVCLDMESGTPNSTRAAWTNQWLMYVRGKLGMDPVLYINKNFATQLGSAEHNLYTFPLWIADYNSPVGHPDIKGWSSWAFQQYTSTPFDIDVFNGDRNSWAKMANRGIIPIPAKPPIVKPQPPVTHAPTWPLLRNHFFGVYDQSNTFCHSGTYSPADKEDIKDYQAQMTKRGWKIGAIDGVFGTVTANVTRQFQVEKHLTVDSKVGPITWTAAWSAPVT